jgi:hypothetical protein
MGDNIYERKKSKTDYFSSLSSIMNINRVSINFFNIISGREFSNLKVLST